MKGRVPLVISGDMHAVAMGRMLRSGTLDLKANPINAVLRANQHSPLRLALSAARQST